MKLKKNSLRNEAFLLGLIILTSIIYSCSPARKVIESKSAGQNGKSKPVVKAVINVVPEKTYLNSKGDIWISTWADDDNMYTINGDGPGFGPGEGNQVRLSKLEGSESINLKGTDVPGISDYSGKFDGSTKTMGLTSIDGVLYAALNGMGKGGKKK